MMYEQHKSLSLRFREKWKKYLHNMKKVQNDVPSRTV